MNSNPFDLGESTDSAPVHQAPIIQKVEDVPGQIALRYAKEAGFVMVPIKPGQKRPTTKGWQYPPAWVVPTGWQGNLGLVHAPSGTSSVDIDQLLKAQAWLVQFGVDLDALFDAPDAVWIVSGKEGRGKLLYRLPFPRVSRRYVEDRHDVINFRSATADLGAGMQDVLPPSVHPDTGKPYQWGGKGHWSRLPMMPEGLLRAWDALDKGRGGGSTRQPGAAQGRWEVPPNRSRAVSALSVLDPDVNRDEWVRIGMAFQAAGGEWEDFDGWSSGATMAGKYEGPDDTQTRWASFRPDGATGPATLYYLARETGRWIDPEMFGPDVEKPEPPPIPDPASDAHTAEAARKLVEDLGKANRETSTEDIQDMARRLARLGADEMDTGRRLKALAAATRTPIGDLRKVYKKEREQRGEGRKRKQKAEGPGARRSRLDQAIGTLSAAPVADCRSIEDLATRYVWVDVHNDFFDRLTCGRVVRAAFDARYQHLGYALAKDGEDGDPAAPPRPSDALLNTDFCVKVDGEDYWPGVRTSVFGDDGKTLLNTWKADGLRPAVGDVTLWLDHLAWLVPDAMQRTHMIQWMACTLRHPDRKINHNIMVGGAPRIGKDSAFIPLLAGLGESNCGGIDADKLEEPYQDAFVAKKLVVFNELHCEGFSPRKLENKLKPFGAAPPAWLNLRRFQRPPIRQRNVVQIVGFSNHRTALSLETSAERWFAIWCAPEDPRPTEYYRALYRWFNTEGGLAAVVHYLTHEVSLEGFEAQAPAPTTAYRDQLAYTNGHASPVAEVIEEMVEARVWPFTTDLVRRNDVVVALQGVPALRGARVTGRLVSNALLDLGYVSSGRGMQMWHEGRNQKVALWAVRDVKKWAAETDAKVWWAARPQHEPHQGGGPR